MAEATHEQRTALDRYTKRLDDKRAAEELARRDGNLKKTATARFIAEAKSQLVLQYNWIEYLSALPTSINLIGACYIAAATGLGVSVELQPPVGGFKHLRYRQLTLAELCRTNMCL